jgi:tRNA modification GTPase
MFSTSDTIVAIATPAGRGGIGVIRLDGPDAARIASALTGEMTFEARRATLTRVAAGDGLVDRAVVTSFPAPHSYTGGDVVEISAHGSPVVLQAIVKEAIAHGARLAGPGEFTFRAYLNGKIDLVQAEAVRDLVDAVTPLQVRVAFDQLEGTLTARIREIDEKLLGLIARLEASLDFPDEGYHFINPPDLAGALEDIRANLQALLREAARGRLIRDGATVAIVGRPNAGKSSLFNRLAGAARAIVTEVPGTTRDLLTERVDVEGVPVTLIDTAGLRVQPGDAIEEEGISRARLAIATSDAVLVVLDRSAALSREDEALLSATAGTTRVLVASKADLPAAWAEETVGALAVSSITDDGMGALRRELASAAGAEPLRERAPIANIRHAALLERAQAQLAAAAEGTAAGLSEEFVLVDLHEARACFDEITGARTPDDVLRMIFERFCIGK